MLKEKTAKQKKSTHLAQQNKKIEILNTVFILLLSVILFFPPFVRGLFFEKEQFVVETFVFIVFLLYWVCRLFTKDRKFMQTPIELASFGLMLLYGISVLYAVSTRDAISEALKYFMYFSVFFMLSDILYTVKLKRAFLWVVSCTTIILCLVGIDGAAGGSVTDGVNQLLKNMGARQNLFFDLYKDGRIFSSLQYPNALASYVMAASLVVSGLGATSRKAWQSATAGASAGLFFLVFILTLSRGAYILVPVSVIILLIVLPKGGRVRGFTSVLVPAVVSVIFAVLISPVMGQKNEQIRIWVLTFACMALSGLLTSVCSYISVWLERISWKIYLAIFFVFAVAAGVLAVVALNAGLPLVLEHSTTDPDSSLYSQKSLSLEQGKNYTLQFTVSADAAVEKPYIYQVSVDSKNIKDILSTGSTPLAVLSDRKTCEDNVKKIDFIVPVDSETVTVTFSSYYQGTKATFGDAVIIDKDTNETVKRLQLKNKYIPDSISQRFENLGADQSSLLRKIYISDAGKMIKDRWLLGAGGKAWEKLYFSYQSFGYSSTQAHNYFIQVAIETGAVGCLILLLLMIAIVYMFFKNYSKGGLEERIVHSVVLAAILCMLVHSALDFDFSLSAVYLLFWELLAVYNAGYRHASEPETDVERSKVSEPVRRKTLKGILTSIYSLKMKPIIAIIITVIILYFPIAFGTAISYAEAYGTYGKENKVDLAVASLKKAVQLDPLNTQYSSKYLGYLLSKKAASQDEMEEASVITDKIEKASTYDAATATNYAISLLTSGNINKGLKYLDLGIKLRPRYLEQWNAKLDAYSQMAAIKYSNGDLKGAMELASQGLNVLKDATETNKSSIVPFLPDMKTIAAAEKLNIIAERAKNSKRVDVNKIIFYNISSMDLNLDGIPDQWAMDDPVQLKLKAGTVGMTAEGQGGYIQSRQLSFNPGKKYIVEVNLQNTEKINEIPFLITSVMGKNGVLEKKDGKYSAVIDLTANTSAVAGYLRLQLPGGCVVKSAFVEEAE